MHIPGLCGGCFFSLDLLQSGCLTCWLQLATESPRNKSGEEASGVTEEIVVEDDKWSRKEVYNRHKLGFCCFHFFRSRCSPMDFNLEWWSSGLELQFFVELGFVPFLHLPLAVLLQSSSRSSPPD